MTAVALTAARPAAPASPAPIAWSFKLATIAGTAIYVHGTFFLLLAWFAVARWLDTHRIAAVASTLGLLLALFACVLLHEFGHVLVARRFGYATSEITLLPVGGLARMERLPRTPMQALAVALAGPAVSLALAALLFAVLPLAHARSSSGLHVDVILSLDTLVLLNIMLALFNLLPAFPLDGGRALQAMLAMRIGERRATQLAARIGQGMAIVFAIIGAYGNPVLLLIAVFVWFGAAQEALVMELRAALTGVSAGDLARAEYAVVGADASVAEAATVLARTWSPVIAIERDSEIADVIGRGDVLRALSHGAGSVATLVHASGPNVIDAQAAGEDVLTRLHAHPERPLLVVDDSRVKGVITLDMIATAVALGAVGASRLRGQS